MTLGEIILIVVVVALGFFCDWVHRKTEAMSASVFAERYENIRAGVESTIAIHADFIASDPQILETLEEVGLSPRQIMNVLISRPLEALLDVRRMDLVCNLWKECRK